MRRYILLLAFLLAPVDPALASDSILSIEDYLGSAPTLPWEADSSHGELAGDSPETLSAATELALASLNVAAEPDPADGDDYPMRGFHSVCYCRCKVPMLDRWPEDCQPDCTTSRWRQHPCGTSHGNCYLTDAGTWVSNDSCCDVWGTPVYRSDSAVRFGWWGMSTDGSPTKVGEYQSLRPSPFWDVDGIRSDGVRTVDMTLTGLDQEANDAFLNYYGPRLSANVRYQRYQRRLDHDPLPGYDLDNPTPPGPDDNVVSQDLNVGDDYAIRVQQLDARFKGDITDNLKWRLNLWGMRKFGERQTNAVAHCFASGGAAGNTCHVVSQSQSIDWLTMEIEPVIEARFENVTVEYSRTMRSFGQSDELATRQYSRFGFSPSSGTLGPDYAYALVPENYTQIDRLKVGATLTENNRLYANLYTGDTHNEFRDTHRSYDGYDLRLMNDALEEVNLTAYVNYNEQKNELPTEFLTTPPYAPDSTYDQDSLRHPVDYARIRAGFKGNWDPSRNQRTGYGDFGFRDGTTVAAGYEYYQLERDFARYETANSVFEQPDTVTHQIMLGPTTRWSRELRSFVRYKVRFIDTPLIGVSEYSEDDVDVTGAFNSNLPEQQHVVDIGGSWTPAGNFMATAQFSLANSWHYSEYANFSENNYPINCSIWYAPTPRLSFTGAYAFYSNWIDQDITLGANRGDPTETETSTWSYGGRNNLLSLNSSYAWRRNIQFVGGYEWNRGSNVFAVPASTAGADWSQLPFLSDVRVQTQRWTAGIDWQPRLLANLYLRYVNFDYDDLSAGLTSGTANMFLAGGTLNW
ncbi:MAG: hypothetical protein CMJ58_02235 [Planctomycetaceae bacterium]|nr:hypothetical protein [Planctomycetaceae bacterium]